MTVERSRRVYAWFAARPAARRAVLALDRWLPLFPFASYPALLGWLGWRLLGGHTELMPLAARAVLVPAAVFAGGSALRRALDRPRPYQQPGFLPLAHKARQGCSFPSRHALSSGVLAAVWLRFCPPLGGALAAAAVCICALRVLTGVHFVRDVVCGAALGFGLGLAGMWL